MVTMKNHRKQLSATEVTMLNAINTNPGLTPIELVKFVPGMKASAASGCTSRLVFMKKVNRVKVPMSSTYRYYPKDAQLPAGYAMWNNTLIKVNRVKKGNGPDVPTQTPATSDLFNVAVERIGKALDKPIDKALETKPEPNPTIVTRPTYGDVGGVLITLEAGKDSITLTFEQAYRIWQQLDRMFGPK